MSEGISAELVERMVAHFRSVASKYAHVQAGSGNFNDELAEVRAIAAALPVPADPDWIEAGEIVRAAGFSACRWDPATMRDPDYRYMHHMIYDAIKRGRELERQS